MIPRLKPYLGKEEILAALGRKKDDVDQFERAFAEAFETKYALAFPYGRSGLWAFFKAMEIEQAEIVMPAYTCSVVAHAAVLSNNIPKFVDNTLHDYNMDLEQVENAINEKTRAIISTHLFGYPLDLDHLKEIVADAENRWGNKIWVVQDCAHSFGARYRGRLTTAEDDISLFGLNASKILTSIFGGLLATNNQDVADRIRKFRSRYFHSNRLNKSIKRFAYLVTLYFAFQKDIYGLTYWLQHRTRLLDRQTKAFHLEDAIGFPSDYLEKMVNIEARVGVKQLLKYREIIKRRRENASYYIASLKGFKNITLPPLVDGATYSHFPIRVSNKADWIAALERQKVELGEVIQYSLPHFKSYRPYVEDVNLYPNSLLCSQSIINLPIHPGIRRSELEKVVSVLIEYLSNDHNSVFRYRKINYFDRHWEDFEPEKIPDIKIKEAEAFFNPVLGVIKDRELNILDIGCGDGVHWHFLRKVANKTTCYTGVDISESVIDRLCSLSTSQYDRFIVSDATGLKCRNDSYDVVFSFGVLGYTSNPQLAFSEMCRVCIPGGWIGIWLYPKRGGILGSSFQFVRWLCRIGGKSWTKLIANILVPFLGLLPTRSGMNLRNASWRECCEIVMVNIAPERLDFFGLEAIREWFAAKNINILFEDPANQITIWGQKN